MTNNGDHRTLKNRFGVHHLTATIEGIARDILPREQLTRGYIDYRLTLHTEGGNLQFPRGHYDSIIDLDEVQAGDQVIVAYLLGNEAVVIGKSYRDLGSTRKEPYNDRFSLGGVKHAVDTSMNVTLPWLKKIWDLNVRLVAIPGVAHPPTGALNANLFSSVAACGDFGMPVGVYVREPGMWEDVLDALSPSGQEDLTAVIEWLALDVEHEDTGTFQMTSTHVSGVEARGVTPIVATARGLWPGIMGGQTQFRDLPLWDSDASENGSQYGANSWPENMNARAFVEYGGWTERYMWQFAWRVEYPVGSGMICDLDLVRGSTEELNWPFPGVENTDWVITTRYGYVADYPTNDHIHHGLDIVTKRSFKGVYAAAAGTVARMTTGVTGQTDSGYGNFIELDHGDGYHSLYGHMADGSIESAGITLGDDVDALQLLGEQGNTGFTRPVGAGYHLHFEWRVNGQDVDPYPVIYGHNWDQ